MAENWTTAFGRYLRILRERRRMSLDNVCSLSQTFADTLNKGYLSRCENGRQRIAFSKIIPLSRIYEVPADVLLERLELDMELDSVGSPETGEMEFSELTKAGADAVNQGFRWAAYAYIRDAIFRAPVDPHTSSFRGQEEQVASAHMSCATAAAALGRYKFALHECLYVREAGNIGEKHLPVLLERLSLIHRNLNQMPQARTFSEEAVQECEASSNKEWLGYVYANRAIQAHTDSDFDVAARYFKLTYEVFSKQDRDYECARALHNLAQVYFDSGRYRAARRAVMGAQKLMEPLKQHRTKALNFILLGEIEAAESQHDRAEKRWRDAALIAKQLNDKVLRFKAEYLLFRRASDSGNQPVARAIERRLQKLSKWVPKNIPEVQEFETMSSGTLGA